ncbi:MAG: hypothetical protein AAB390_04005 [Patescibacteria group bacterium]
MIQIIPSILVQSKPEFIRQIAAIETSVMMAQIDIADGKFVPDSTWAEPEDVESILKIDCELHLMTENPVVVASLWKPVIQVKKILFHYEAVKDVKFTIDELRGLRNWDIGIVLNPATPLEVVKEYAKDIQGLMLMGVNPGKQGQKYLPETTARLIQAKKLYPNLFLEMDGGISEETLPQIIATGPDAICPGSLIFGNELTPAENVEKIKKTIARLTTIN